MSVVRSFKNDPTLTLKEQLGLAGGIFGNTMGQDSVHTYADIFARDFMGISPSNLQKTGNITAIFSFLNPTIAGAVCDKSRPNGKMTNVRRLIGAMPIPFALFSMMMFVVPSTRQGVNFWWNLVFGLLFATVDCFFDTAINTLSLRMVARSKNRQNFFTLTSIASTLGSMLPGWIIPLFADRARQAGDYHAEQWSYFYIAMIFCILGLAAMMTSFFTVKDRPVVSQAIADTEKAENVHWDRRTLTIIGHNRPFVVYELSILFDSIRQITYSMLPYIYKDTFGDYKMKMIIDMISGTLSYAGLAAVPFVGKKVSARSMMIGGYAYTGFFYAVMALFNFGFGQGSRVPLQNIEKVRKYRYLVGVCLGLAGMPNVAMGAARKIIVADSTDYMEWYSAKRYGTPMRSDGALSGVDTMVRNVSGLVRTNIYNIMFRQISYTSINAKEQASIQINPNGTYQSNETLRGIYRVATLCGLIGNILGAICFLFDNYTGKRKVKIDEELAQIRAYTPGFSDEASDEV